MPRVRLRSLLELSLLCIVDSIDHSLNPSSTNNKVVEPNWRDLGINPFHQLPTSLLERIIRHISFLSFKYGTEKIELKFVLEYLMSPQLRIAFIFYYPEDYLNIFPRFGKLLSLYLNDTRVGDKCLQLIGIYCKNIRILELDECFNVTDTGVQLLLFNNDGIETDNQRPAALCKTLQHLSIYSTSVTNQGIQMAINNLIVLQSLVHERLYEFLLDLIKTRFDFKNLPKIRSIPLTRFSMETISPYESGSLAQVIQFCPSLTSVKIIAMKGITDSDILSLMSLTHLIRFHLRYSRLSQEVKSIQDCLITFKGGVVPILKKFGHLLEDLDISFFIVVDIWTILKFCPYLYILTFYRHCDSVTALSESELELNRSEKERFILKNLVELDCSDCNSPDILHFLWSFPLLANIYSVVCDTVTDEFLFDAVKFHKFKNLRMISLRYCDFVTKRGIDALMTHKNGIELIKIHFCHNLTLANAYEWYLQAKRESWKFEIFFQNSGTVKYYSTEKYLLL